MERNNPTHEVRLGTIRATIWANHREGEDTWYRVTTSRLYKEGSQWRNTQSFRPDDLPTLGKVLDMAHDWLLSQMPEKPNRELEAEDTRSSGSSKKNGSNKKGKKRHGGNMQGRKTESTDERVLMRQSRGDQLDQSRGGQRSGTPTSARKKSPRA